MNQGGQPSTNTTDTLAGPDDTTTDNGPDDTSTGNGPLMCDQESSESNDTESTARDLGTTSDCNGGDTVTGVLEGVTDIDWYKYQGTDEFGINCSVDPVRSVTASQTVEFCKYIQCIDEEADFECPGTTDPATSPDGRAGCCGPMGFQVDFICGGSSVNDDSAWIYMSIETTSNTCVDYDIDYDF